MPPPTAFLASRTELRCGDEGDLPASSVPKGADHLDHLYVHSPTGSVPSRKLANCILSRKPVKSKTGHPNYQERMRQSFSYRPCYTRTAVTRTLQSETRAVSCHWCRGLHLEQLPHSIGHNHSCPQMLPVRRWGMARALSLSQPPTLSRLNQNLPPYRRSGNQAQGLLRRYATPISMSDTYARCRRRVAHIVCSVKSWLHSSKPDPSSGGCACSDHASGL